MKKSKRGFTLTEVLVVVVVIGILAAVVLPKYRKMMDTYKTAEAERLMESVRNVQETYYELNGSYLPPNKVTVFPGLDGRFESENFTYVLGEDYMTAESYNQTLSYTLEMDYDTGEICCDGEDCSFLDKIYEGC